MDKLFILPHTHYDAEVFQTREVYLEVGYKVIIDALNLLKSDPDYHYSLDQSAYVGAFLQAYPECAETFQDMVRQGRLEIIGGMHVMADLNVTSGESIVRQFEFGKGYYRQMLGTEVKTGWMIDTFGHCRQMPQIMKKCGFDSYFFARVANVAHSEFYWQGIDGTLILTHWMPGHYIVFSGSPNWYQGFHDFVLECYRRLKPFAASSILAAPEGGDFTHPVRHDTAFVRKWNDDPKRPFDLAVGTPKQFIAAVLKDKPKLDVITDDFNPVFQGCYSARIRMKQQNRLMESLLYDVEAWNGLAAILGCEDRTRQIHDAWEPVLFNQVHDVIGGVQMDHVFENVQKRYVQAENLARLALEESLDFLVTRIDTRVEGIPVAVFNSLCWERTDQAKTDIAFEEDDVFQVAVLSSCGISVPTQVDVLDRYPNGAIRQARLLFIASVPALGYEVFSVVKNCRADCQNPYKTGKTYGMQELNEAVMENDFYRIRVDLWKGCMTSLVLKETGIEMIDPDVPFGNMLVSDEDNGDFWEIGTPLRGGAIRPIEQMHPLRMNQSGTALSIESGGTVSIREKEVTTEFVFSQKIKQYEFTTTIRLLTGIRRIEIESDLLNREKNVRYRIAFPTTIRKGTITNEIPFGSLERPEGEYPALNWADYSEPGKGLGVLNCGLPGNAVIDDKMLLSIMKCTSFVGYGDVGGFDSSNSSDGGHEINVPHQFRYALVPHQGDWRAARLPQQGSEMNHPLIVRKTSVHAGELPSRQSFINVDSAQVMGSSVRKKGKDLLLRIYETTGNTAEDVHITFSHKIMGIVETNLLGDAIGDSICGLDMVVNLKPYEIRTFRINQEI
jgi:alpha-mannosidase